MAVRHAYAVINLNRKLLVHCSRIRAGDAGTVFPVLLFDSPSMIAEEVDMKRPFLFLLAETNQRTVLQREKDPIPGRNHPVKDGRSFQLVLS